MFASLKKSIYDAKSIKGVVMQFEPPTEETLSPCIKVCQMNEETGKCLGCYRTSDEIAAWDSMSKEERAEMWKILNERLEDFLKRAEFLFED